MVEFNKIRIWLRYNYLKVVNSIAFYPAIIALLFLVISAASIAFDFSEEGKQIKSQLQWLKLRDPSTARSIIGAIVAGIITLTVFSFSMVMIVLNQTASQLSNRILDRLIGSRFQQVVLGVYVGTMVYALFLLSTIRDVDSGIYIPALSTYLLIALTICDIFLFIYFLHYITQSVKYDVIINRIHEETLEALKLSSTASNAEDQETVIIRNSVILSGRSGIYEGFSTKALLNLCDENDCVISLLYPPGTYILKGIPIAYVSIYLSEKAAEEFTNELLIHSTESIKENFFYGFRQLSEVGIKALSPGINDPGTAIQAMRALFDLYTYRITHFSNGTICNRERVVRIVKMELTFDKIFEATFLPIWDYGKGDRMIRNECRTLLSQMILLSANPKVNALFDEVNRVITKQVEVT